MTRFTGVLFVSLLMVASSFSALATPIALTFDDAPAGTIVTTNLEYQGFRFSPNRHYDLGAGFDEGVSWTSKYIAFDPGFGPDAPDYRGASVPGNGTFLFLEQINGEAFSLLGLQPVSASVLGVISSAGGFRDFHVFANPGPGWAYQSFSGPEWENVEWLRFYAAGGTPQGFDDLTLSVPEPTIAYLIIMAAFTAGLCVRFRRQDRLRLSKD